MSGDELAAAVYAERGYLVVGANAPLALGDVRFARAWDVSTPLRITAISNRQEFEQCERVAQRLVGYSFKAGDAPYYYRVEAAD